MKKEDYTDGYYHDIIWNPAKESLNEFLTTTIHSYSKICFMFAEKEKDGNPVYRLIIQ